MYQNISGWNDGPDGTGNPLPDTTVTYKIPADNTALYIMAALAVLLIATKMNTNGSKKKHT